MMPPRAPLLQRAPAATRRRDLTARSTDDVSCEATIPSGLNDAYLKHTLQPSESDLTQESVLPLTSKQRALRRYTCGLSTHVVGIVAGDTRNVLILVGCGLCAGTTRSVIVPRIGANGGLRSGLEVPLSSVHTLCCPVVITHD